MQISVEPVKPAPPKTPRELFQLLARYDDKMGLDALLDSFDWTGVTPHQIYYAVLSRLPEKAKSAAMPPGYSAKTQFRRALKSDEFQTGFIKRLVTSYPEKTRYLFVHIPKCAGSDLSRNLSAKYPFLRENMQYRHWMDAGNVLSTLNRVTHKLDRSDHIYLGGHFRLSWYLANSIYRFGDRIFTVVRNPYHISISQVNYIITRFCLDPGFHQPDTKAWAKHLNLSKFDPDSPSSQLKELALRIFHHKTLVSGRTLCTYLGAGSMQSAVDLMARCNIEITDVDHYNDWLWEFWNIQSTTRYNQSQPIIRLEDLDQAQRHYLSDLCVEDMRLYDLIMDRLAGKGGCRIFGTDLM